MIFSVKNLFRNDFLIIFFNMLLSYDFIQIDLLYAI